MSSGFSGERYSTASIGAPRMKVTLLSSLALADFYSLATASRISCNEQAFSKYLSSSGHKNAVVVKTSHVSKGGTFNVPASDIAYPQSPTDLPELCVVQVNVTSSPESAYAFGLFLPMEWNERFL